LVDREKTYDLLILKKTASIFLSTIRGAGNNIFFGHRIVYGTINNCYATTLYVAHKHHNKLHNHYNKQKTPKPNCYFFLEYDRKTILTSS